MKKTINKITDLKNGKIINLSTLFILTISLLWGNCKTNQNNLSPIDALSELNGKYIDLKPYEYGKGVFGKREFTFSNGLWTLDFVLALDPKLQKQIFRFRTLGSYKVLKPSELLSGSYEANFSEEKKYLTLITESPELAKAFGLSNCGLTTGVEKDISETGCALWKSVKECPIDHDLLKLDEDGRLYFGVRPRDNNMCKEEFRPKSLTPPVEKI